MMNINLDVFFVPNTLSQIVKIKCICRLEFNEKQTIEKMVYSTWMDILNPNFCCGNVSPQQAMLWHQLGVLQYSSILTLHPGDSIRSHRLETAPHIVTRPDQSIVNQRFPQLPPWSD